MANSPHNMNGRECFVCGYKFTPASMTLTITRKSVGIIEHMRVCGKCYNTFNKEEE